MYPLSIKQWNPFVGCLWCCLYCILSFQHQLKRWAKGKCSECYRFKPHCHDSRLNQPLPQTGFMQFIFVCASADISFCPDDKLLKIVDRMRSEPNKTFLLQSKHPKTFNRVRFPKNVILGTTLETNRDNDYDAVSKAPKPSKRYDDFVQVVHPTKMVTIEPVMDFDMDTMLEWIEHINPCMVWLGYDSRKTRLPEPSLDKVRQLYWELGIRGFTVMLKTIRKAWWEQAGSPAPRQDGQI